MRPGDEAINIKKNHEDEVMQYTMQCVDNLGLLTIDRYYTCIQTAKASNNVLVKIVLQPTLPVSSINQHVEKQRVVLEILCVFVCIVA